MGFSLTRRWLGAAIAAVLMGVMAVFLFAGPVQADDPVGNPGVEHTVASTDSVSTFSSPAPVTTVDASASAVAHRAAKAASDVPEGSPLYVQIIMIAALVVLGVGYFKLMGHSGRRAPKTKPTETDAKQSVDA